jgi:hypothetical protein
MNELFRQGLVLLLCLGAVAVVFIAANLAASHFAAVDGGRTTYPISEAKRLMNLVLDWSKGVEPSGVLRKHFVPLISSIENVNHTLKVNWPTVDSKSIEANLQSSDALLKKIHESGLIEDLKEHDGAVDFTVKAIDAEWSAVSDSHFRFQISAIPSAFNLYEYACQGLIRPLKHGLSNAEFRNLSRLTKGRARVVLAVKTRDRFLAFRESESQAHTSRATVRPFVDGRISARLNGFQKASAIDLVVDSSWSFLRQVQKSRANVEWLSVFRDTKTNEVVFYGICNLALDSQEFMQKANEWKEQNERILMLRASNVQSFRSDMLKRVSTDHAVFLASLTAERMARQERADTSEPITPLAAVSAQ